MPVARGAPRSRDRTSAGVVVDGPLASALGLAVLLAACGAPTDPPGRVAAREASTAASSWVTLASASETGGLRHDERAGPTTSASPPTLEQARLASIAMRTWVYQEPREDSQRLGYLRAGAVVERDADAAGFRDCAGGWYRIAPRGYVCVGKGASLDVGHPIVLTAHAPPRRGEPLPYRYVFSTKPPPHLYFKLPSEDDQRSAEGSSRENSIAQRARRIRTQLGAPDAIPESWRGGVELPKPYGAETQLGYRSHRGRAKEQSAFGLIGTYDWTGRPMGLTTELDLIPLDRTRVAEASALRGVVVPAETPGTPAFVLVEGTPTYERVEGPSGVTYRKTGEAPRRSGWVLTGKNDGSPRGRVETTAGVWLPGAGLLVAEPREDPAGFAEQGRKWIDVSIEEQLLVAYEGRRPVFAALVSTGKGELGDPEKTTATVRGTFMIAAKHVSATMDGDDPTREAFDLRDVPYVQYFHKGYALHAAYWHDAFGRVRSHGCVNLAPADAAWLFEWTEPAVPEGWHGALNPNYGTLVYTHR